MRVLTGILRVDEDGVILVGDKRLGEHLGHFEGQPVKVEIRATTVIIRLDKEGSKV